MRRRVRKRCGEGLKQLASWVRHNSSGKTKRTANKKIRLCWMQKCERSWKAKITLERSLSLIAQEKKKTTAHFTKTTNQTCLLHVAL